MSNPRNKAALVIVSKRKTSHESADQSDPWPLKDEQVQIDPFRLNKAIDFHIELIACHGPLLGFAFTYFDGTENKETISVWLWQTRSFPYHCPSIRVNFNRKIRHPFFYLDNQRDWRYQMYTCGYVTNGWYATTILYDLILPIFWGLVLKCKETRIKQRCLVTTGCAV
jgi:hypothetical protein